MKKILRTIFTAILIFMLTGCAALASVSESATYAQVTVTVNTEVTTAPETPEPSETVTEIPAPSVSKTAAETPLISDIAETIYNSYLSYFKVQNDRLNDVSLKIGSDKKYDHVNIVKNDISGCTVAIMPLTALGGDKEIAVLKSLGFSDIQISQKDGSYIMDYMDPNKKKLEQTCSYDTAKDSLQSIIRNKDGKVVMFFEYVNTVEGYAFQAYELNKYGSYMRFRSFFNDKDTISCGIFETEGEPVSMFKDTKFDVNYVDNSFMYFIFSGKYLKVYENGNMIIY